MMHTYQLLGRHARGSALFHHLTFVTRLIERMVLLSAIAVVVLSRLPLAV